MLAEVKTLHKQGVSWERLESFGLEYRYLSRLLQNKLSKQEMFEQLECEINKYAKRQMTWFKRDLRIHWFPSLEKALKSSAKLIRN